MLDLSQAVSGPYAGRALADLGADVVKVEWPNGDLTNLLGTVRGGISGLFTQMNAGKRGVAIDRRAPGGAELVRRLAGRADVVIENFRPGVLDRAGLGYAELSAGNPALVMLSISGFGATGPEAQRRAYAPVIHAESGLLGRQAELNEGPVADLGLALADMLASLHGTVAVLAALALRQRTGTGQHVDLSMLEAMVATDDYAHHAIDGSDLHTARGHVWDAPGGPILISADPKALWAELSKHAGLRDASPPGADLETKIAARSEAMAAWIRSFPTRPELIAELERAGLAWGEVRDTRSVLRSPSLEARGCVAYVDDHAGGERGVIRMPYRFSDARAEVRGGAPRRGQDNRAVLGDWLGMEGADIDALVASGVLLTPVPSAPA